jgi:hypothetical protein
VAVLVLSVSKPSELGKREYEVEGRWYAEGEDGISQHRIRLLGLELGHHRQGAIYDGMAQEGGER